MDDQRNISSQIMPQLSYSQINTEQNLIKHDINELINEVIIISEESDQEAQLRKNFFNSHPLKPSLYSILCEMKEKTGIFSCLITPLSWRGLPASNYNSLLTISLRSNQDDECPNPELLRLDNMLVAEGVISPNNGGISSATTATNNPLTNPNVNINNNNNNSSSSNNTIGSNSIQSAVGNPNNSSSSSAVVGQGDHKIENSDYICKRDQISQRFHDEMDKFKEQTDNFEGHVKDLLYEHRVSRPIHDEEIERMLRIIRKKFSIIQVQLKQKTCEAIMVLRTRFLDARRKRRNFSKQATETLNEYFYEHLNNPYPSEEAKEKLAKACGITISQVSNWFGNKRIRYKKNIAKSNEEANMYSMKNVNRHNTTSPNSSVFNSSLMSSVVSDTKYPIPLIHNGFRDFSFSQIPHFSQNINDISGSVVAGYPMENQGGLYNPNMTQSRILVESSVLRRKWNSGFGRGIFCLQNSNSHPHPLTTLNLRCNSAPLNDLSLGEKVPLFLSSTTSSSSSSSHAAHPSSSSALSAASSNNSCAPGARRDPNFSSHSSASPLNYTSSSEFNSAYRCLIFDTTPLRFDVDVMHHWSNVGCSDGHHDCPSKCLHII